MSDGDAMWEITGIAIIGAQSEEQQSFFAIAGSLCLSQSSLQHMHIRR